MIFGSKRINELERELKRYRISQNYYFMKSNHYLEMYCRSRDEIRLLYEQLSVVTNERNAMATRLYEIIAKSEGE